MRAFRAGSLTEPLYSLSTLLTGQAPAGGLGALLLNLDSDLVLALVDPLKALHGIVQVDAGFRQACGAGAG
jgi:hypothetical protein